MRLSKIVLLLGLLLASIGSALGDTPAAPTRLLPEKLGKFTISGSPAESSLKEQAVLTAGQSAPFVYDGALYTGPNGGRVVVEIVRLRQDSEAYELLSLIHKQKSGAEIVIGGIGTAGFVQDAELVFFKGLHVASITNAGKSPANLNDIAHPLSERLDRGEGDIPALIKHLPSEQTAQKNAVFLSSFDDLNRLGLQQPVLTAIASGGNADAALASYGPSKVLIVEFHTPQLATDNDTRIIARIRELWNNGQPAPTAYKRVGNYSVFVFDAPDEQSAKQLIDQVKYEQVVQWLGENPNIFKEAEKRYINTTLGVLVAVLKASGYALIACLGLGALFGGLLFSYRRAQQREVTAYSDAGGMLRLNLDELTPGTALTSKTQRH